MSSILIKCPHCLQVLKAASPTVGVSQFQCPRCGKAFTISAPLDRPAELPPKPLPAPSSRPVPTQAPADSAPPLMRPQWAEVSARELNEYRHDAARRVAGPAIALIVVGCLGILGNCVTAVVLNALRTSSGPVQRPPGVDEEIFQAQERGRAAAPLFDCCLFYIPTLAIYSLVIVGGIRMLQVQNRGLAMTGAILAMAPCSPIFLLGLPVGIWSVIELANPTVRAAFDSNRRRR